jgi:hypothetical protein
MRFPKYQWMQEEPTQECGFCDNLVMPSYTYSGGDYPKFQVLVDETKILDVLSNNPFASISSPSYDFQYNGATPLANQIQLFYFGGVQFCIKKYDNPLKGADEVYFRYLNGVYYIDFAISGTTTPTDWVNRYYYLFNEYILPRVSGMTANLYGPVLGYWTIELVDVPANSYFYDSGTLFANFNILTPNIIDDGYTDGFLYNSGSMCMFETTNTRHIRFNVSLVESTYYYLSLPYTSNGSSFTVTYTITPLGAGSVAYDSTPITITNSGGELVLNLYCGGTDGYAIDIEVTDNDSIGSGLCFNEIKFYDIGQGLKTVAYIDCDEIEQGLEIASWEDFPSEVMYKNTFFIQLIQSVETTKAFRFQISDYLYQTLTSRWYSIRNTTDCDLGRLYLVEWTNDCDFDEIRYNAFPFTNKLLLTGALIKGTLENLDSVDNITASGKKVKIYLNTQAVYEFRIHPFLADTMELIIERIFEHSQISIEGNEYTNTDVFKVSEIDMGIYTGRIDLYKSGTSVISSSCCC